MAIAQLGAFRVRGVVAVAEGQLLFRIVFGQQPRPGAARGEQFDEHGGLLGVLLGAGSGDRNISGDQVIGGIGHPHGHLCIGVMLHGGLLNGGGVFVDALEQAARHFREHVEQQGGGDDGDDRHRRPEPSITAPACRSRPR